MPQTTKRRRIAGASANASTSSQPTLSFRGAKGRVTKANPTPSASKSSKSKDTLDAKEIATPIDPIPTPSEKQLESTAEPESKPTPTPATPPADSVAPAPATPTPASIHRDLTTEKALALPVSALNRYWQAKESARTAPRVHQSSISLQERILREFDLTSKFGPCVGIDREQRWWRADGLGLNPPLEVLAVLLGRLEDVSRSPKSPKLAKARAARTAKPAKASIVDRLLEGGKS